MKQEPEVRESIILKGIGKTLKEVEVLRHSNISEVSKLLNCIQTLGKSIFSRSL
jgi:hypothetical protein